jgi:MoaA/NifB/PqqE/SkfB family radical SAM enzyme
MRLKSDLKLLKGISRNKFSSKPYKMNFAVTNRCNSRCITCQTWQEYQRNPDKRKEELSLDEISRIFKNISSYVRWMSLTGGEPFLRDDLIDIARVAAEKIPELALIAIPTNGLLVERILKYINHMKSIEGPDISISFSLDGPPSIHNEQRGISGAYEITWKSYIEASKLVQNNKRFHIHLETTISSHNIQYLRPFFEELLNDGHNLIVTVAHDAYLYKNTGNKNISLNPNDRTTRELFSFLYDYYSWLRPVDILNKAFIRRLPHFLENGNKQVLPCAALKCSFALNPYGGVLPCLMWGKVLGNVRDSNLSITAILNTTYARDIRRQIMESKCPNCWTPCEAIQTIIQNAPRSLFT